MHSRRAVGGGREEDVLARRADCPVALHVKEAGQTRSVRPGGGSVRAIIRAEGGGGDGTTSMRVLRKHSGQRLH